MRWAFLLLFLLVTPPVLAAPPNVLIVLTDDQGHGDFGFTGNPKIRTPNLDRLARESVWLKNFHVSPVCTPTRASLMTGRYNYRTCAIDTFQGRAMMHPDEVTLAQMFAPAGYRCGIFGKWHLGDNYPMRPGDRGFHESLVLRGGGLRQPGNRPDGDGYFDPILEKNGQPQRVKGYCSDVFTDAAIGFIEANRDRPWLVYLPFNAPHSPLELPEKYVKPYQQMNLKLTEFPAIGQPVAAQYDIETTARIYGMVENIDDNLGKLLGRLKEWKLADNTIVVFFTDNGPQQPRFNSGLRGLKGTVYEGGIRTPCLICWPSRLSAGKRVDRLAAHIDLAPTLLELAGVATPSQVRFDGVSLKRLLEGSGTDWHDRTLFFQWHRGDVPELYRAFAARTQQWKLAQPAGVQEGKQQARSALQLFDLEADPFETTDLAEKQPEIVIRLKKEYEAWFKDVSSTRGYDPPKIVLGSAHEPVSLLTRQDLRVSQGTAGHWEVKVAEGGDYQLTLIFGPSEGMRTAHVRFGDATARTNVAARSERVKLTGVHLPAGDGKLEVWLEDGKERAGVKYVEVKR